MSGLALVRMGAANRFALFGRDGGHQGERLGAGAAGRGVAAAIGPGNSARGVIAFPFPVTRSELEEETIGRHQDGHA